MSAMCTHRVEGCAAVGHGQVDLALHVRSDHGGRTQPWLPDPKP